MLFITCTAAAAAGRTSTQKDSPSLVPPTRRCEQTRSNSNLPREEKESSVMNLKSTIGRGESAPATHVWREMPWERFPSVGTAAGGPLDGRAARLEGLQSRVTWKTTAGVRLIKCLPAFRKAAFPRSGTLWDGADHISPAHELPFSLM